MYNLISTAYSLSNSISLLYTNSSYMMEYIFSPLVVIVLVTVLMYLPVFVLFMIKPSVHAVHSANYEGEKIRRMRVHILNAIRLLSEIREDELTDDQKREIEQEFEQLKNYSKLMKKRKAS